MQYKRKNDYEPFITTAIIVSVSRAGNKFSQKHLT